MIEYTEWSAIAEATTESAAIPQRFVILADIRLSTEAPEAGAPPIAAEESKWIVVSRQQGSSPDTGLFVYERKGNQLELASTKRVANVANSAQAMQQPRFTGDNKFVAVAHEGSVFNAHNVSVFSFNEGVLDKVSGVDVNTSGNDVAVSANNSRVLLAHNNSSSGVYFNAHGEAHCTLFSLSESGSLAVLDNYRITGTPSAGAGIGQSCSISPNGNRAVLGSSNLSGINNPLVLLSLESDIITELDLISFNVMGKNSIKWHPDGVHVAVCFSTTLRVYSTAGNEFSQVASVALGNSAPSNGDVAWNGAGTRLFVPKEIYSWDGSGLTKLGNVGSFTSNGAMALTPSGGFMCTLSSTTNERVRLHEITNGSGTVTDQTGDPPTSVQGVAFSR